MNHIDLTLGLIIKDSQILLGMKKRGFGEGKWNGFGGKILEGETPEMGIIREFREEAQIEVTIIDKLGIMDFHLEHDTLIKRVHIFMCSFEHGIPSETEEMRPKWFDLQTIPFSLTKTSLFHT
jgi:ADP-ribose pyrophosphatase YjhB (NUDIX family)